LTAAFRLADDRVEMAPVGDLVGEDAVTPAIADDPGVLRMGARIFGHSALKLLERLGSGEVDAVERWTGKVGVGVLESWSHETAPQIDDPCRWPGAGADLGLGADSEQAIPGDGERLRAWVG